MSDTRDALPSPCMLCGSAAGVRTNDGWRCAVCTWPYGDVPDPDLPRPRVDVVYYIRFDDRIKIGTSSNPKQRLARLWHQELLVFERGDRALERQRHEQFAQDRWPGSEWFRRGDALDAHVAGLIRAAALADPWQMYARWVAEAYLARG